MSRTTKLSSALTGAALGFTIVMGLSGCTPSPATGTSDAPAPTMSDVQSAAPAAEAATETKSTYKFGETATFDGLSLGISAPAAFTPSEYAMSGTQPNNVKFTITLTNTGTEPYDPTLTYITASSASQEAEGVYDTEANLGGAPSTTILPGASTSYEVGFNVADPAQIVMDVSSGFDYAKTTWTN
jgi:hypothetical protein